MAAAPLDHPLAPACRLCGGRMHYESWDFGWLTFHTVTGEFFCPDPKQNQVEKEDR